MHSFHCYLINKSIKFWDMRMLKQTKVLTSTQRINGMSFLDARSQTLALIGIDRTIRVSS